MKKILVAHRYYWPDSPPYALILKELVDEWRAHGHTVDVLSSLPSYKASSAQLSALRFEAEEFGSTWRLPLESEAGRPLRRVYNAVRLGLALLWRALLGRYDVIMISTAPPILAGFFAAVAARVTRAKFIYHCMDIHPEIGRISGEFSNALVFRLLRSLDAWSCRAARQVVVLSEDMAESIRSRPHCDAVQCSVINNFALPSGKSERAYVPGWPDARFVLLFAGNVGRFQGLEQVVEAMVLLKGRADISFVVMGEGVIREQLEMEAQSRGANIKFIAHQPIEVAKAAMRMASACYLGLRQGVHRYAYPSKTMTYLEQGAPIIASIEPKSSVARDLERWGCGVNVRPDDAAALASAIQALADDDERLTHLRGLARAACREFSCEVILKRWQHLIDLY